MSSGPAPAELVLSLDDLAALNDEIAALARCGISLERGLAAIARDLPGRLGLAAAELSRRLAAGESLAAIFAERKAPFPRVYGALVEAGRRSGHLPAALEALSITARRVAELRRLVGQSLLYPLLVASVAYTLFMLIVSKYLASMMREYAEFNFAPPFILVALNSLCAALRHTWFIPPLVVLALLTVIWIAWGRAQSVDATWAQHILALIPGVGRALRQSRSAAFSEVLALLVEFGVPLPEAVPLAANAAGDSRLRRAAAKYAERVNTGQTVTAAEAAALGLPRLVGWVLAGHRQERELVIALKQIAADDRRAVERRMEWLNVYLPVLLSLVFGCATTLVYAVAVFWPWFNLLYRIAEST